MPAPIFAHPEPLPLSDADKKKIADTVHRLYRSQLEKRVQWERQHLLYDQMFRGEVNSARQGPWPGASNFHVPMPYWAVDSINTRAVSSIWSQTPLVSGIAEEEDDAAILREAIHLVDWDLQPKRMNARRHWSTISKTRCIHGAGVGLIAWAKTDFAYAVEEGEETELVYGEDGRILLEPNGTPKKKRAPKKKLARQTQYDGPVLVPVDWDDVITPDEGMNLQPKTEANPLGCDWVGIRQWQPLSFLWKRRDFQYAYISKHDEAKDRKWWEDRAPSQDRSSSGGATGDNQRRARQESRMEGRRREGDPRQGLSRANPEFETLMWFMPWEIKNEQGELEETECVFYVCLQPKLTLGAFRLSDVYWKNKRTLLELHYQRVGTRYNSMGIMEIARHLSAELDTLHNMRIDVGFATNLPFFFYRASSAFDPNKIVLRPLKGIPVDDINDVRFPQMQNVTSFYAQEEQLIYTLVERVLGITDLFLGISPTHGAAARHATGFVGTQQEAMARASEMINYDAEEFSFLCETIHGLELQYGPEERHFRLQGQDQSNMFHVTRNDLWFRGDYDFRLGSNTGLFSSMMRQQRAQALLQSTQLNPLIQQDPGRLWEVWNEYYYSIGVQNPELFIGPKEAISAGTPKRQDEETAQMVQMAYGMGIPAPVHPSDNDMEHIRQLTEFMASEAYANLGSPNSEGLLTHAMQHQRQMTQKQAMLQAQAQQRAGVSPGPNGQGPALGQERIAPQLEGVGGMGRMGAIPPKEQRNGRGAPAEPPPQGLPAMR